MKVLNELYTVRETTDIAITVSIIMGCDLWHLVQLSGESVALVLGKHSFPHRCYGMLKALVNSTGKTTGTKYYKKQLQVKFSTQIFNIS